MGKGREVRWHKAGVKLTALGNLQVVTDPVWLPRVSVQRGRLLGLHRGSERPGGILRFILLRPKLQFALISSMGQRHVQTSIAKFTMAVSK